MRIGIDISQMVHEGTGVARYVRELTRAIIEADHKHEYVLFGASFRKRHMFEEFVTTLPRGRVILVPVPLPVRFFDVLWNVLHVAPIEWFIGDVDVFWSSDWTQPPLAHARGITTIHDLSFIRFPDEHDETIKTVHARRLRWVKKECTRILCDSEATKQDVTTLLDIPQSKLTVVYPGFTGVFS